MGATALWETGANIGAASAAFGTQDSRKTYSFSSEIGILSNR